MSATMHVMSPTYRPAGGVVKLMDYACHALEAGFDVAVWCPESADAGLPLFRIPRLGARLVDNPRVRFHSAERLDVRPDDFVLVSMPTHFPAALGALPPGASPERIIHLIQNVRHVNPAWLRGFPARLLTWPAARISLTSITGDAIAAWLDERGLHQVIALGHETGFFRSPGRPPTLGDRVNVGYTTWKSDLGDRVAEKMAGSRFDFRCIREPASWDELRDLYHWADIFLATPGPEEGFYMPGLEALEAECLLLTPDVGGNMAYCRAGENCRVVPFEDDDAYMAAILELASLPGSRIEHHRRQGLRTVDGFSLEREREEFLGYLSVLRPRVAAFETATAAGVFGHGAGRPSTTADRAAS
jgi:hypothetical protein